MDAERKSLYGQQMDNYFSYMGLSKIKNGDSVGTEGARESYKYVNGEKVDVPHTHIEINPGFFYNTNILRPWASFAGYGTGVGQLSTIQSPKISDIIEANPELEGFSMNPYPYIDAWFEAYREERA